MDGTTGGTTKKTENSAEEQSPKWLGSKLAFQNFLV